MGSSFALSGMDLSILLSYYFKRFQSVRIESGPCHEHCTCYNCFRVLRLFGIFTMPFDFTMSLDGKPLCIFELLLFVANERQSSSPHSGHHSQGRCATASINCQCQLSSPVPARPHTVHFDYCRACFLFSFSSRFSHFLLPSSLGCQDFIFTSLS